MELLYLYIPDDGMTIIDQSFNLSSRFIFTLNKVNDQEMNLKINKNPLYLTNFVGEDHEAGFTDGYLMNITGIIGENGVGKTNLMHYLIKIFNDEVPYGEPFIIAALKDQSNIEIYHTLEGILLTVEIDFEFPTVSLPVEQKTEHIPGFGNYFKTPNKLFHDPQVIYYNPNFDTSEVGAGISVDNKSYVDISTRALITRDLSDYNDSYADEVDSLTLYRSGNTRRQFSMLLDEKLLVVKGINLPSEIDIRFPRSHFYPDQNKRNLTDENRRIFAHLDDLVKQGFAEVNSKLNHLEHKVERGTKSEEYKDALREKLNVEFSYAFIHNFFYNLNMEYNVDLGVKLDEIQGEGLLERTGNFLSRQSWNGKNGRVKADDFYYLVTKIIWDLDSYVSDNDGHFSVHVKVGSLIIEMYESYHDSLPIEYKRHLLLYGWRNISSGENALLDLYTRLYFARNKRLKEPRENGNKLYILIDEGDATFHPQWQRDYLANLVPFIKGMFSGYQIQLFLTSHSPYLVSDLPRENLIFLEKVKGFCKVSSLVNDETNQLGFSQPTLAANINRLLGDRFFMKTGAIGKFAWELIERELGPLEPNSKLAIDEDRIRKLALLIGEQVLSSKINEVLANKLKN